MTQKLYRRITFVGYAAGAVLMGLVGCASASDDSGWITLVNGSQGMENFNRVGANNWTATDGVIQAGGSGVESTFLVSKNSYQDFLLRAQFWVSEDANSGIFIRCQNTNPPRANTCYEVNIFDRRPDPSYGTGAIVDVAKSPTPMPKAGGKWTTYEISAKGNRLILTIDGVQAVNVEDAKHPSGPFALQWAGGTVKFRKVEIKPL